MNWVRGVICGCLIVTLGVQAAVPCCVLASTLARSTNEEASCPCEICCTAETRGHIATSQDTQFQSLTTIPPLPKCPFCASKVDLTQPDSTPTLLRQAVDFALVSAMDPMRFCPMLVRDVTKAPRAPSWVAEPYALGRLLQ